MVLRLKPVGKIVTPEVYVLDRTKVLHGPPTQTYGETGHSKKPNYWTEPWFCMVLRLNPMGKLVTLEA